MDKQRSNIKLKPVTKQDIETVWRMQIEAFSELLEKYQDYDMKKGDGSPVHNSKNIIPSLFVLKKYKYGIYIQNFIN